MTNEEPSEAAPLLTGKSLVRVLSDCLKWIGFRPGAPIYRAEARFTLDDVKQALFPVTPGNDEAKLVFVTTVEREEIHVFVTAIREWYITGDEEFAGDLFPSKSVGMKYWTLEGLLLEPDVGMPGEYTFAISEAYDRGERWDDLRRVPIEDEDMYLKVIAVIACNEKGQIFSSLVQRVPSPADQILHVPPS